MTAEVLEYANFEVILLCEGSKILIPAGSRYATWLLQPYSRALSRRYEISCSQ
jgi:hypothetical protein